MAFVQVGKFSEIKDGGVKGIMVGDKQIAIFRLGSDIFVLSDVCSHAGCILSENHEIDGEEVQCACHGSRFNIRTGQVTNPPALEDLETYPVKVEGGQILVSIEE
ncbi:hypothetical protein A2Z23_02470 [Candidatus Curtissbacteria bacterium RBG_16_39_7]|uniref:Rieske domain-containing protein n=1 Tax=Candidatus Curtissbacteria bacterium RBG_16_39_7 TaxID=1797707 RepID=A0A1F5G1K0_9BACT|nr:MAG: hypothetical protein A2Z23_02470 [Candidatus Curtissbacteria bacterium RBG_16_39_7]